MCTHGMPQGIRIFLNLLDHDSMGNIRTVDLAAMCFMTAKGVRVNFCHKTTATAIHDTRHCESGT
jgi:hypothetical protein